MRSAAARRPSSAPRWEGPRNGPRNRPQSRVTKGLSLCHIAINVMEVWRNELKTSVNVINVTFYLG